ncbi:MAG: hypothetical protein A2637_01525 [Candidatus Muproteobacteria bacterium RIFCSPHIGHO2_01_FULL_65_16]|uniref:PBP domain-containing protein n=1 Tax=Candidatus Muproteobacteria bacterium RIFCSPHIGHO2_01_FULL_65_16 TaxID=1817764 RepID=A0A1F6TJ25_9PROT|nr:MAG: hypothetical protein A2637_01525 [Candidatus Muproteobacteria bacterium RIFCSPHIGHO2_01_FULL_65_16]
MRFLRTLVLPLIMLIPPASAGAGDDDRIRIGGSGGGLGAMKILAAAFKKTHPLADIVVLPSLGSSGGIKAAIAGSIDVGLSSRPLKDTERAQGAVAVEYGRTPFVFVAAPKVVVSNITLRELIAIYAGKTGAWPDGKPLRLVLRPEDDSDTRMLRRMSPAMDAAVTAAYARAGMIFAVTTQESMNAVEKLPGALGVATLAQIISEKRAVKVLSFEGVTPAPGAIAGGKYPYFKPEYMITGPKPSRRAREFIAFVRSRAGQEILTSSGYLVVTAAAGVP